MRLEDLPSYIDIDVDESLEERFMDSEELLTRFLRRLAESNDFAEVELMAELEDWQETLRRAHNLKGVCASLGLRRLQELLGELVRLLRTQGFTARQVQDEVARIKPEWERTLACIRELE